MKNLIFFFLSCLVYSAQAQFINNGGIILVKDAHLISNESIINQESGLIINQGTITTKQDLLNLESANLATNETNFGSYQVYHDFINSGNLQNCHLQLSGSEDSQIESGNQSISSLQISKYANANVTLVSTDLNIEEALDFNSESSRLILGDQHLFLAEDTDVFGYDEENYIVTNGIGQVKKSGFYGFYLFPVGTETSYHPASMSSMTVRDIGLRVEALSDSDTNLNALPFAWLVDTEFQNNNSWNFTTYWTENDEPSDFNRSSAKILELQNEDWIELPNLSFTKNNKVFSRTSSINQSGKFTVGQNENEIPESDFANPYTSIQNSDTNKAVWVYPNPSINFIRIEFTEGTFNKNPLQIRLYDLIGQILMSKTIETLPNASYQLDFPEGGFAAGIYQLQISQDDIIKANERIVIQTVK